MITNLLVPVDGKTLDWPRKAANAINFLLNRANRATDGIDGLTDRVDALEANDELQDTHIATATGWGNYSDPGTQAIPANTRTLLTISGATKDETQKPGDIATFWNGTTSTLPGRDGDGGTWRLKFRATPDDAVASTILIEADIGGAIGVLDEMERSLTKGAAVSHAISWSNSYFMRATFAANGAKFYVTTDGPVTLTAKSILVHRTHKAR